MPVEPFLELSAGVARALSDLHRQGIHHGHISPRALAKDPATGAITIIDPRSAPRPSNKLSNKERAGKGAGAPSTGLDEALIYMAPEQTGRMNRRVDHRADLYSLGVVFYELLTGALPLRADDALGWVHAHVALSPVPPAARVPALPEPISAIIMRLLSKAPEDRYQSARGLARDLERGLGALKAEGRIDPFPLGEDDLGGRIAVPQKLYGRSAELELLHGAFQRVVKTGKPEFITVTGHAGIGKSSLVNELERPLLTERGLFISGKFEQFSRGSPYATLVSAFRELTQQLLTESDVELAAFRARLQEALGSSGRLIVDVLPDIKLIVGEQPPVPELGPTEAQNRFQRVFQRFIRAIARPTHPIALFLDDLQWADSATLDLLAVLADDPELRHIAFLLAYRDGEVDEAHPLRAALASIERAGAAMSRIRVEPLAEDSIAALVADTLRCSRERAGPLARVVLQKTAGNPFFAGVFLRALHQEGLIVFDEETRSYQWDLGPIEARSTTDNVVDLVLERLRKLPPETLSALTMASCLGTTFRAELLAGVAGVSPEDIARRLIPATQEELIAKASAAGAARGDAYRFEHDRIQQAAYSLLDADDKQRTHLAVGRLLLAQTPPEAMEGALFDIVNQLDLALPLITGAEEKQKLAELNAAAGRKAKAATAYAPARQYLRTALSLAPSDAWTSSSEEAMALHSDVAECEYLCGNFEAGEALLDLCLERARDPMDLSKIYVMRLLCYEKLGRTPEGLATGLAALRRFGIEVPDDPAAVGAAFGDELARIEEALGGRRIADLIHEPPMPDGIPRATMILLAHTNGFTYMLRPELYGLLCAKSVVIALRHGSGLYCAKAYGPFSVIQAIAFNDLDKAYEYSLLALGLCERFNDVRVKASHLFAHGAMLAPFREHYDVAVEYTEACFNHALEHGDYGNGNYAGQDLPLLRFARGDRLESTALATKRSESLAHISGQDWNARLIRTTHQVIQSLRGLTSARGALGDEAFDDAAMLEVMRAAGHVQETAYTCLVRLIHAFLFGRYTEALAWAEATKPVHACQKQRVSEALYVLYRGLTFAALHAAASPDERPKYREEIAAAHAAVGRWAKTAPVNFQHQHLLLEAELARADGRALEAMSLYEKAARGARQRRFHQDEGIARERAATLFLDLDQPLTARAQLAEACEAFQAWGAAGKVAALADALPDIAPALGAARGMTGGASNIDLLAVLQASQALSGEIDRDLLLRRLMTITLKAAAAERGCLVRVRGEELVALAEADASGGDMAITVHDPKRDPKGAADLRGLPLSIVHYARRTRAVVVLDDAGRDTRFTGDPSITEHRPLSVLCLPLQRQAELIGVLYLENNLARGAFTKERTAVLELLASQAAISIENATLYTEVRQENAERRRAEEEVRTLNNELEERVLSRTAELAEANRELEAFSYAVSHDLQAPARKIRGFAEALAEDYGPSLDAEGRGYLDRITATSGRMLDLIDDMLRLARATRAEMVFRSIDLSAMARDVSRSVQDGSKGRSVTWVIEDGIRARGDEKLARVVLENLLGNAFKFTSKRPEARIEVGTRAGPGGEAAYFVRDNGAGFDMSRADRLFGAFQRLHKEADFAGTGVGLATVQRIVGRHGGRAWAEGAVGEGATFYFTLASGETERETDEYSLARARGR